MPYSIIIPIFNEEKTLEDLLKEIKKYQNEGNEIIIVNDGSEDNTSLILDKYKYVKSIHLRRNYGKGIAIKIGLLSSKYHKTIIFDGDLELRTNDIKKLMLLDEKITCVMGTRYRTLNPIKSSIDWGNFMFTVFFNLINRTSHKDILCCAKSFYIKDIPINKLKSKGFDIDVELTKFLSKNNQGKKIAQVFLKYKRRSIKDGKKLRILDGWVILKRILLHF